MVGVLQLDTQT